MTDQTQSFTPASSDLDPGQVAAMRDSWASYGYDLAKFDAALAAPSESHDGHAADGAVDIGSDMKTPALAPYEALQMAEALRAAGVPQDKIDAALAADGIQAQAPDTRTDEEKEYDLAFAAPAPEDYRVNYRDRFPPDTDLGVISEANRQWTSWASEIGLPPEIGAAVIEQAIDCGRRYESMSEPRRQLWQQEQKVLFERVAGGPEKAAERMALAAQAIARGGPAVMDALHKSGALHDASIILHLANQAERHAARGATS